MNSIMSHVQPGKPAASLAAGIRPINSQEENIFLQAEDSLPEDLHGSYEQVVAEQQEKKYQQHAYQDTLDKKLQHHAGGNPEHCIPYQSAHRMSVHPF